MRWDIAVAGVAGLVAWFWWAFVRVPSYLRGVTARVPMGMSVRQLLNGTFMTHAATDARFAHIRGAPLSLQWAFGWILHVHDVDLALAIVRHSPTLWQQIDLPAAPWSLIRRFWGQCLPVANNPHWKSHRTIAAQAFTVDSLRHIHALSFLPTAKHMADAWHHQLQLQPAAAAGGDNSSANSTSSTSGLTVDVTDTLGRYSLLSLGRALFGFEFDEREARYVVDTAMSNLLQPSRYIPGSVYDLLPNAANAVAKDVLTRLNALIYAVIHTRRAFHSERDARRARADGAHDREHTRESKTTEPDADAAAAAAEAAYHPILMDHLLRGSDERGARLSDAEVRDETLGFLLAGLDSSQLSLSTALWLLAHNPTAQQRCYDELVRVCGEQHVTDPHWPGPTFDDARRMEYAQACVYESVRLYRLNQPVRACNRPVAVGGVQLPAGTIAIVDAWSLHRSTTYWGPDADRFRPERWLDASEYAASDLESATANGAGEGVQPTPAPVGPAAAASDATVFKAQVQAFFAFGGSGPRACPGRSFAVGWQRVALSLLLARFVFRPAAAASSAGDDARPTTQVLGDGKSTDLKFANKGLFNVPFVRLTLTPRPGFGHALLHASSHARAPSG